MCKHEPRISCLLHGFVIAFELFILRHGRNLHTHFCKPFADSNQDRVSPNEIPPIVLKTIHCFECFSDGTTTVRFDAAMFWIIIIAMKKFIGRNEQDVGNRCIFSSDAVLLVDQFLKRKGLFGLHSGCNVSHPTNTCQYFFRRSFFRSTTVSLWSSKPCSDMIERMSSSLRFFT